MFSCCFADAHLTENILEDLPQNLANLGCILPIVTKEKYEEEIIGRSGINFGKEIRNKNMMKKGDGIYSKSNTKVFWVVSFTSSLKTETLNLP